MSNFDGIKAMIDLGIIELPLEAINVVVITTAVLLAAKYIGFNIISAIGGLVALIYGIRTGAYEEELIINGYEFASYEGWLLAVLGAFLLYRGTSAFFDDNDVNTWK